MRNLKRALSLALASVMLLGMMVVGSSAAGYDDVDQEDNVEAIAVLQAVKVMNGYDDGLFHPEANVTRNQMAKIICALKGVNENDFATVRPYTDVPEWAANAVGACTAYKIVNGRGNGIYDGDANVTAIEAAAMLLRTLGYTELPLGDGWDRYVAEYASRIRLFNGINIGSNEYMNRDQIAKLTLNALESPIVDVDNNTVITMPDGTVISSGNINYVVVASGDDYAQTIHDNQSTTATGVNGVYGYIVELGEQLYNGELKLDDGDVDDFGRPARTWSYKNDKVGTYSKKSDLIATYTGKVSKGDIYGLLSSTVRSDLESSSSGSAKLIVTVDGYQTKNGNTNADAGTWYARNDSTAIYTPVTDSTRNGTLTEVYLDSDNNVNIAIINTYVYQATSDYSSSRDDVRMAPAGDTSLALKGGELTLSGEDFNISNIQTDDYLLITATSTSGTAYEVQSVKVAEKVTGEVTGYTEDDSVTIDGSTYKYSATTLKSGGVRSTTYTVGQEAVVVLDDYGNIIAVDEAVSSSSFVFIKAIDGTSGLNTKAVADAYFTDGTSEEITLDRVTLNSTTEYKNGSAIIGQKVALGNKWYTYSIKSDGKYVLYGLRAPRANDSAVYTTVGSDTQIVTNGKVDFLDGDTAVANDKTIMVVKDDDGDVRAYTGTANIPDITLPTGKSATVYFSTDSKGYTEYAFVDLVGTTASVVDGSDDTSFLYVLRSDKTVGGANGTRYYTFTTINPETGAEESRAFDYDLGGHPYQLFYKPRTNSDDRITSLATVPISSGKYFYNSTLTNATVSYNNGSLTIGSNNYIMTSDSKVTLVIRKDATTLALLNDDGANHEYYFNTQGNTIDSLLDGYLINGSIAGATKSDSSRVIDTLYITVNSTAPDMGTAALPDSYNPMSLSEGDGPTAATGVGTAISVPAGYTLEATSDDEDVATVAVSGTAINVTPEGVGTATITVKLTNNTTGQSITRTISVTVAPAKTDGEKMTEAKNALTTFSTSGDKTLDKDTVTDAATAKEAALAKVKALTGVSADVTITEDSPGGTWTAATAETTAGTGGADATYQVTYKLEIGTEAAETVGPITFTVTGSKILWEDTPAGKAEADAETVTNAFDDGGELKNDSSYSVADSDFSTNWSTQSAAESKVKALIENLLDGRDYTTITVLEVASTSDTSQNGSYNAPSAADDELIFYVTIDYSNDGSIKESVYITITFTD